MTYAEEAQLERRQESLANPFDVRNEVSADARHIVKHIWIVSVLIPALIAIAVMVVR